MQFFVSFHKYVFQKLDMVLVLEKIKLQNLLLGPLHIILQKQKGVNWF